MTAPLLLPGATCAQTFAPAAAGLLIDGEDFYRAVFDACRQARRTILMTGWQFDSRVELLRGADAAASAYPTAFLPFLAALCRERPELEVYLLAWESSPVFTFEREPLQKLTFEWRGHRRIHYKMDNCHPVGASQHQKLIIADRSIAFTGGMDVCCSRWDDREHRAENSRRADGEKPYHPYHDVQAYVRGPAVDLLRDWFCERWQRSTRDALLLPEVPVTVSNVTPTLEVVAPTIGLTRTLPTLEEPPAPPVFEIRDLHTRAIRSAERLIYMESQYFSSDELASVIIGRLEDAGKPRLEIVIILPKESAGFKERISIGVYQAKILQRLFETARRHRHHLGIYYTADAGPKGDVPVFIHSKVLAVDDRFLLVSSANATNRSMGFDSELGLAWEAPEPTDSLREARIELLREHVGVPRSQASDVLEAIPGLVQRLNEIAIGRTQRLRVHELNRDERVGPWLEWLVPDKPLFDPARPFVEDMFPEPRRRLDRVVRDPVTAVFGIGRRITTRLAAVPIRLATALGVRSSSGSQPPKD